MSFVRPETRAILWKWREVIVGAAIGALGAWNSVTSLGLVFAFWIIVAGIGAVILFAGLQRLRFRRGKGGVGVVHVDERQVSYFGPMQGGVISIESLVRVELQPAPNGVHNWVLMVWGDAPLTIPVNAERADALFDVFNVLKGIETEKMLAALNAKSAQTVVIWAKPVDRLH